MEISEEIKNRIAHQYFGSKYIYKNEFGTFKDIVGGYHTQSHIKNSSFKLCLKPLSSITDEDAHKVGMLCGCSMLGKAINTGKELCERMMIERHLCLISYSVYQYLQSKGYDLPNYFLENKTLQESGLATY